MRKDFSFFQYDTISSIIFSKMELLIIRKLSVITLLFITKSSFIFVLQESFERAKAILKTHAKEHKQLAEALLQYETLDADDVAAIANGK